MLVTDLCFISLDCELSWAHVWTHGAAEAPGRFKEVRQAGTHEAALTALQTGDADLAAFAEEPWRKLKADNPQAAAGLVELWRSDPLPAGPVVCVRAATTPCDEIEAVLLSDGATAAAELAKGWSETEGAVRFRDHDAAPQIAEPPRDSTQLHHSAQRVHTLIFTGELAGTGTLTVAVAGLRVVLSIWAPTSSVGPLSGCTTTLTGTRVPKLRARTTTGCSAALPLGRRMNPVAMLFVGRLRPATLTNSSRGREPSRPVASIEP